MTKPVAAASITEARLTGEGLAKEKARTIGKDPGPGKREPTKDIPLARTSKAAAAWTAVKQQLAEVSVELGLDSPDRTYFRRIESGFTYRAPKHDTDFHYLHVEPLLDQAADLLERAFRERGQWDELAAKAAQLSLELSEYTALDAIHVQEEAAGIYLVDSKVSASELAGDNAFIASTGKAVALQLNIESYIDSSSAALDALNATVKSAWVSGLWNFNLGPRPTQVSYHRPQYGTDAQEIADHLYNAAIVTWRFDHKLTSYGAGAQKWTSQAAKDSVLGRLDGTRFRDTWNQRNVEFRKRRTIAARNIQDVKAKLASDPDGILNYAKRLPAIKRRFESDFSNALARMMKAEKGLKLIFGYTVPLPTNTDKIDHFDDCLLWCRDAIHWIIRFARRDQGTVQTIPLRELLSTDQWDDLFKNKTATFALPETTFSDLVCVRMRGISLCSVPGATKQRQPLLKIRCKVPQKANYRQLDGSNVELDAQGAPICQFGRVAPREHIREPDVLGATALHNISPIGEWEISVQGAVGQDVDLSTLDDIEIDLHVAFRTMVKGP